MKITLDSRTSQNVDKGTTAYRAVSSPKEDRRSGYALDISGTVMDNTAYGVQGRTAEDIMQEAGNQDITLLRNYMTVMSHSMSDEDFAKLQKDGYHPGDMDIETAVTIVDKIKAEMAKAGIDVIGYTDDIDSEKLAEITGSEAYAQAVISALHKADVPVTEQNVKQTVEAADKAAILTEVSEGTAKYMVTNAMEPTIDNVYKAEYSGTAGADRQAKGYYQEELPGYYAKKAETVNTEGLQAQIEKAILQAGLTVTEETLTEANWLVEKGIPLTTENLLHLQQTQKVSLPISQEEVLPAIAGALAEGKKAGDANLFDGRSIYQKAADIDAEITKMLREAIDTGNVTARRQLEEVRLKMTVEANVKLLKSGFSIDTGQLEELVEALKQAEQTQAGELFGDTPDAEASYALYRETIEKTAEIPYMPAAVIGRAAAEQGIDTLDVLYQEGKDLQEAYRKAGESYETLMTVPRSDMGDNIKTAFRNIDDILSDMGMAINEENRRAVRILGYNSMELTEDNLLAVKQADRELRGIVNKITPAAALRMIRDGINPLNTDFKELSAYLDNQEGYADEAEKYSRYLYNLEQNKEITPEEKEAYIGIYRMLRQIEKTDGAAIGSLINSKAELSFSNLLSAVRTRKAKGMDVKVEEGFGTLSSLEGKLLSITEQIEAGYTRGLTEQLAQQTNNQKEQVKTTKEQLAEEVRQGQTAEKEVLEMLKNSHMPITISNLAAAAKLHQSSGSMWRKIKETAAREPENRIEKAEALAERTADVFEDSADIQSDYQEALTAVQTFMQEATFSQDMSSVDIRSMQLINKQLSMAIGAAEQEEYYVPVTIEGETTAMHLKIEHSEEEKGTVRISVDSEKLGRIEARFTLDETKITGYMIGAHQESTQILGKISDKLQAAWEESGWECSRLDVIQGESVREPAAAEKVEGVKNEDLYKLAKTFIAVYRHTLSH